METIYFSVYQFFTAHILLRPSVTSKSKGTTVVHGTCDKHCIEQILFFSLVSFSFLRLLVRHIKNSLAKMVTLCPIAKQIQPWPPATGGPGLLPPIDLRHYPLLAEQSAVEMGHPSEVGM